MKNIMKSFLAVMCATALAGAMGECKCKAEKVKGEGGTLDCIGGDGARPSRIAQSSTLNQQRVDVPAQSFDAGGWKLDVQFIDVMGSPYLLAHGCGIRVADAKAHAEIPSAGTWRVWVRARKWVDGAGAFKVRVGGKTLGRTFGASQSEWAWEDGGTIALGKGTVEIALVDQDGFDGRCAGIALTRVTGGGQGLPALPTDVPQFSTSTPPSTVEADFVVVGGGVPGTCAAVAAARRGLRVALVQDRPVLGGNASSEIRVWSAGEAKYPLVRELRGWFMNRDANMSLSDAHRMRVVEDEKTLSVHLCHRVVSAETEGGRIVAVKALDWKRNRIVRFRAPLFCDATGDGWLGYYAGADWRMGREARSEYDEPSAPEKADDHTLGASLMWTSAKANTEIPFSAPWAEPHAQGETAVCGEWNWEYGIRRDMIREGEAIRDRLLLAIYGAFSRAKKDPVNARLVLDNVPFLLGKRESRRLLGDWVYSERDVTEKRLFEDAIAAGSWSVDLHYDDCKPGVDFLTTCRQPHYGRYWIPYRSIYSRNVSNLFMAGRCFSCTHVGLGGPRVINTLAQLGCAAGEAAAMCREDGLLPRGIWEKGLVRKLQRRLGGDFPGNPDPETAGWRIVDDETPGVTFGEGWRAVHNANGEQVGDVAHVPGKKACSWNVALDRSDSVSDAIYPLPVEKKGRHVLLSRVPYYHSAPMDSRTCMEIVSDGKAQRVDFNQAVGSGTWRRVGEFELSPGAMLRIIASESHGCVVADGFALVPLCEARRSETDEYDLVVAGGTLDAVRLAVREAKAGKRVYLVAPRPYLGEDRAATLILDRLPTDDVNDPLIREIFNPAYRAAGAYNAIKVKDWRAAQKFAPYETIATVPVPQGELDSVTTPLLVKRACDKALLDAGVKYLTGAQVVDVATEPNATRRIVVAMRGKDVTVRSREFVDCRMPVRVAKGRGRFALRYVTKAGGNIRVEKIGFEYDVPHSGVRGWIAVQNHARTRVPVSQDLLDVAEMATVEDASPASDPCGAVEPFDVVVAGGGTGGGPAALAAARNGAKTLVVEFQHVLGGVSTEGRIGGYGGYYDGNVTGFTKELDRGAKAIGKGGIYFFAESEFLRRGIVDAGGEVWLGAMVTGAEVRDGKLVAVKVTMPDGSRVMVPCRAAVDATGNCDLAAAAGCSTEYMDPKELSLQGVGMAGQPLGANSCNSDIGFVDETDAEDLCAFALRSRLSMPDRIWNQSSLVDSRERRRLAGRFRITPLDLLLKRTYPDTVSIAESRFDTHGQTVHPVFFMRGTGKKTGGKIRGNVPYRALLPKEVDGILVTGLGVSAHRDAMPVLRMKADIRNMGYAAGIAAAMSAKANVPPHAIDVKTLQRKLVEIGNLPPEVLDAKDNMPLPDSALAEAAKRLANGYDGIAELLSDPVRAMPILKRETSFEAMYVRAMLGDATAAPALIERLAGAKWDAGWNFKGMSQYERSVSEMDAIVIALGNTRSVDALPVLAALARQLTGASEYSHFRAISRACDAIGGKRSAEILIGALAIPGVAGHAIAERTPPPIPGYSDVAMNEERSYVLRELCVAVALYRLGDPDGSAMRSLTAYLGDPRRVYANFVRLVLGGSGASGVPPPVAAADELPVRLVPAPRRLARKEGAFWTSVRDVDAMQFAETPDTTLPPEGYTLSITPNGIAVRHADAAGAFYARQTLHQLASERGGGLAFPCVEIEDAPAFRWRGLLLDESRHFFGLASVRRFLDLMARHKLNVFHWHLTDSQGWRLQIDRYPALTTVGAKRRYSTAHKHLLDAVPEGAPGEYGPFFYTKDEVRAVIAYAAARHIRVVPEIEIPGHSRAALRAFPELLCFADDPSFKPTNAIDNAYCAGNDKVLRFLEGVLDEVCELFPDPVVHIGGDEVRKENWKVCPKCRARMAAVGAKSPEELQAWMNGHFAEYLAKKGKRPIWWGEIPEGEIPADLAVMSWLGPECGIAAAKKGHEVVMCPHKSLYFDYTPCVPDDPCTYPYFTEKLPVSKVYAYDPLAGIPAEYHRFVLGGEGCNWTEYTCSQRDLDWKCWTRAAAMAEVLWTAPKSRDLKEFMPRLRAHVARLKKAGVNCAPVE